MPYYEYAYEGPVTEDGKTICRKWSATTYAPTPSKARSNLTHRFKKEFNKEPYAKIVLPGKIQRVTEEDE